MSTPAFLSDVAKSLKTETPLGFFTLQLLLLNVTMGGLAHAAAEQARFFVTVAVAWDAVLAGIVTILAVWRPEALRGVRPRRS